MLRASGEVVIDNFEDCSFSTVEGVETRMGGLGIG
jgi:hypothetical protein